MCHATPEIISRHKEWRRVKVGPRKIISIVGLLGEFDA
jgi:hypothetical protein